MRGSFRYTALLIASLLFYSARANADTPSLSGVPSDPGVRGKVFAEAWLAYRREMDGLAAAKVPASECNTWFDWMPTFLLRDTLRLAVDPEVIYQSAARLAELRTVEIRELIRDVRGRFGSQLLGLLLDAERIRAGDAGVRSAALSELKSPIFERRRSAGVTLAAAGDAAGYAYLRSAVRNEDEEGRFAAWALGRFGDTSDEQLLRAEIRRRPRDSALAAALGVRFYQRVFPGNYQDFMKKYRFLSDGASQDGMYESWHIASLKAIENGARDIDALRTETIKLRKDFLFGDDSELTDRRLAAFVDFLDEQRALIGGRGTPFRPTGFQEAVDALHEKGSVGPDGTSTAARRIAAAIALVSVLAPTLDYPEHAAPTAGVIAVSPNADRVLDGNIGTSWHLRDKTTLVLEHTRVRYIRSVYLLMFCGGPTAPDGLLSVAISGVDKTGRPWTKKKSLGLNLFQFQKILIAEGSTGRIQVNAVTTARQDKVCISEVRVDFRDR